MFSKQTQIIFISPAGFGGIQTWCISMGEQMQEQGFNVSIVWEQNRAHQIQNPKVPPEIKEINFLGGSYVNQNWAIREMAKHLKQASVIYPNTSSIGYRAISRINKKKKPIVIAGCHSIDNHDLNTISQFEPICDIIFTLSNQMTNLLKKRIQEESHYKLKIIRHGIAFKETTKTQRKNNIIQILVVGRLDENKQPILALEVLNQIIKNGLLGRLTYIGEGHLYSRLIEYAKKNNLYDFITFSGTIPNEDVEHYYKKSHFTLLLSKKEGFGLVALEAMCQGSIPIVTNSTGVSEILLNNVNGFVINVDNAVEEASERIISTFKSEEKLKSMVTNAKNTITDNYTILHSAINHIELIESVKKQPPKKNKITINLKKGLLDCILIPNGISYRIRKTLNK